MITLETIFTKTVIDPKGNRITDLNEGLKNYYPQMLYAVTHNPGKSIPYLADDRIANYPDLAAYTLYDNIESLPWFLFSNFIENPFTEIKSTWVYYQYSESVQDEVQSPSSAKSSNVRYGATVTLN